MDTSLIPSSSLSEWQRSFERWLWFIKLPLTEPFEVTPDIIKQLGYSCNRETDNRKKFKELCKFKHIDFQEDPDIRMLPINLLFATGYMRGKGARDLHKTGCMAMCLREMQLERVLNGQPESIDDESSSLDALVHNPLTESLLRMMKRCSNVLDINFRELHDANQRQEQQNENLQRQLSTLEAQNDKQLSDLKTQNDNLLKRLSELQEQNCKYAQETAKANTQHADQLLDLKMQNESLLKRLSELQAENVKYSQDLKTQNESLSNQLTELQEQNGKYAIDMAKTSAEHGEQLSNVQKQNEDLLNQFCELQEQVIKYAQDISDLKVQHQKQIWELKEKRGESTTTNEQKRSFEKTRDSHLVIFEIKRKRIPGSQSLPLDYKYNLNSVEVMNEMTDCPNGEYETILYYSRTQTKSIQSVLNKLQKRFSDPKYLKNLFKTDDGKNGWSVKEFSKHPCDPNAFDPINDFLEAKLRANRKLYEEFGFGFYNRRNVAHLVFLGRLYSPREFSDMINSHVSDLNREKVLRIAVNALDRARRRVTRRLQIVFLRQESCRRPTEVRDMWDESSSDEEDNSKRQKTT